jgi:flagellar FliL protein
MSKQAGDGSGGSKKRIIIIGVAILVVGLIAGALWFSGVFKHIGGGSSDKAVAAGATEKPILVDLPDIVSNLDTGSRRASFIKIHAKLQVGHAAEALLLQSSTPQVLDIFHSYLRSTRPEELRGGEGTYRLREAIMNRIDMTLAPVQVTDLLFTEILVQ